MKSLAWLVVCLVVVGYVLASGLQAKGESPERAASIELATAKAENVRLTQELATKNATIDDLTIRLSRYEQEVRSAIEQKYAPQSAGIEKRWMEVEVEFRTLLKPKDGEKFDRVSLTFRKADEKKDGN